jgi:hypothetical protein
MDVSSIATAYTAFSEVLVGFAWGTESHSGQRDTSECCGGPFTTANRATSLCVTLHKGTLMHAIRARRSAGGAQNWSVCAIAAPRRS